MVRGAVAFHAPEGRRACEAGSVSPMDDLGGERRVPVVIRLAHEDREPLLVPFESHDPSLPGSGAIWAAARPAHTAAMPAVRLAAAYASATPTWPFFTSRSISTAK